MAGEMVSFASNGGTANGYLAKPGAGRAPGVVVIQEWWGLNAHIKEIADRFASAGYLALAPDLYDGKTTTEPDEAGKMMMAMKMEEAAHDMGGAYEYLKSSDACTGEVGSVGYCMGGGLSLFLATVKPIDACVVYYGAVVGAQPDVSKLRGPVLGHYAEDDGWATPDTARALKQQIESAGGSMELHIYPGTEHAFFNDSRPEVYNADAAAQSWERTLAFYKQHLS